MCSEMLTKKRKRNDTAFNTGISNDAYFESLKTKRNKRRWKKGNFWVCDKDTPINIQIYADYLNNKYSKNKIQTSWKSNNIPTKKNKKYGFTHLYNKYNKLITHNMWLNEYDVPLLKQIILKNMRIKNTIYKFFNKLKKNIKKTRINDFTLYFENFTTLKECDIISINSSDQYNKYFDFKIHTIANVMSKSFIKPNPDNKIIPKPEIPSNPYNRNKFTTRDILMVYQRLQQNGYKIPLALNMFIKCNLDLQRYKVKYSSFLKDEVSLTYVRELDDKVLLSYVKDYIYDYNYMRCIKDDAVFRKYKLCNKCTIKLCKEDRNAFSKLIRDYIYFTNSGFDDISPIVEIEWRKSQIKFQNENPNLNSFAFKHTKCIPIPKSNGNPFIKPVHCDIETEYEDIDLTPISHTSDIIIDVDDIDIDTDDEVVDEDEVDDTDGDETTEEGDVETDEAENTDNIISFRPTTRTNSILRTRSRTGIRFNYSRVRQSIAGSNRYQVILNLLNDIDNVIQNNNVVDVDVEVDVETTD